MKRKLKPFLFRETYRAIRRYQRICESTVYTEEEKLCAKVRFNTLYGLLVDSGYEQEYLDWRAEIAEGDRREP